MWLDARHLGQTAGDRAASAASVSRFWERRFPTILATARSHGVDPVTDLIPVAPACHYASGGVRTDLWGRSDLAGLYATGEAACSGVHGANRLASNSLLEGLVFSRRIADVLPGELRDWADPARDRRTAGLVPGGLRRELQETMTAEVGVLRSANGLAEATAELDKLAGVAAEEVDLESWETTNLVSISTAMADAAALREETRGSHWREDFPERDDERFAGHFDVVMRDGETELVFVPSPATDTL
jgi:L-aspartate oxidase